MSHEFFVGQKVLCINDIPHDEAGHRTARADGLRAGEVYTISDMYWAGPDHIWTNDGLVLVLQEITRKYQFWIDLMGVEHDLRGFCHIRFRPLDDTSLDVFREMCNKTPQENWREFRISKRKEKTPEHA